MTNTLKHPNITQKNAGKSSGRFFEHAFWKMGILALPMVNASMLITARVPVVSRESDVSIPFVMSVTRLIVWCAMVTDIVSTLIIAFVGVDTLEAIASILYVTVETTIEFREWRPYFNRLSLRMSLFSRLKQIAPVMASALHPECASVLPDMLTNTVAHPCVLV